MRTQVKRAFTLIEILIVVVILGILAAIVIPQFTDASQDAMVSSVQSQLQTLRGQIELYNVQNPATPFDPITNGNDWDPLIQGNYIQTLPKNPFQNGATGIADAPAAGVGWTWYSPTGNTWDVNLYGVDEAGADFDGDGDGSPD